MNRNLFDTTVHRMPDLACPAWCSADHGSAWVQQLEATSWAQQQDPTRRIDAALLFESSHRTELPTDVDPGHGCESLDLEVVQHFGSAPELALIAELGLTAEQARAAGRRAAGRRQPARGDRGRSWLTSTRCWATWR